MSETWKNFLSFLGNFLEGVLETHKLSPNLWGKTGVVLTRLHLTKGGSKNIGKVTIKLDREEGRRTGFYRNGE